MKEKLIAVAAFTSVLITIILALLTFSRGEFFLAFNVQLLMTLFVVSVTLGGTYLLNSHTPHSGKRIKLVIGAFGLILSVFAALVLFDIIHFLESFNWLISFSVLYVLLVQLQLLRWGNSPPLVTKVCAFLLIISNIFLVIFFIAKWTYSGIALWIDITVLTSLISFIIGLLSIRKTVSSTETP